MGPLHTIDGVMSDLKLGRTRVYELIKSNALVAVKLGQGTRITDESLQGFKKNLQPLQR
jgi:excisionase family DNA binding protein